MPDPLDPTRLSRTVAHALRHDPVSYSLELDEGGWVSADALVAALRRRSPRWAELTHAELAAMVDGQAKRRYELVDGRIRAVYGHSVPGRVTHRPAVPPPTLYHGTTPGALASIRREGLRPMGRQYVHLSSDNTTASTVGERRATTPVVVEVAAGRAHAAGVVFFRGGPDVWLVEGIPAPFLHVRGADAPDVQVG